MESIEVFGIILSVISIIGISIWLCFLIEYIVDKVDFELPADVQSKIDIREWELKEQLKGLE